MNGLERIAQLETKVDTLQSEVKDEVIPLLKTIEAKQNKQAGFIAGITFAWTMIAGLAATVWQYFTK